MSRRNSSGGRTRGTSGDEAARVLGRWGAGEENVEGARGESGGRTVGANYDASLGKCKRRVEWTAPDEPTLWLAIHYRGGT